MISRAGPYRLRWGPWSHLRVILCAIWPGGASTVPARPSTGILPAQNRRKTVRVWKYGAIRVQKSSKHCAGLHGMPCEYLRGHELPGSFMWPRHKNFNATVTWVLRVFSGPYNWGNVGICGSLKVCTKSHSCSVVVTCVLLVISALWPQNNVNPYMYHTGSIRSSSGIVQVRADAIRVWEHHVISHARVQGSKGPVRCPYKAHRNHKTCEPLQVCRPREGQNLNRTACRAGPYDILCRLHNFQTRASYEFKPVEGP